MSDDKEISTKDYIQTAIDQMEMLIKGDSPEYKDYCSRQIESNKHLREYEKIRKNNEFLGFSDVLNND